MVSVIVGVILVLVGLILVVATVMQVWRGLRPEGRPTPHDRAQYRNQQGAELYERERPRVAVVRLVRRRPVRRPDDESKL